MLEIDTKNQDTRFIFVQNEDLTVHAYSKSGRGCAARSQLRRQICIHCTPPVGWHNMKRVTIGGDDKDVIANVAKALLSLSLEPPAFKSIPETK